MLSYRTGAAGKQSGCAAAIYQTETAIQTPKLAEYYERTAELVSNEEKVIRGFAESIAKGEVEFGLIAQDVVEIVRLGRGQHPQQGTAEWAMEELGRGLARGEFDAGDVYSLWAETAGRNVPFEKLDESEREFTDKIEAIADTYRALEDEVEHRLEQAVGAIKRGEHGRLAVAELRRNTDHRLTELLGIDRYRAPTLHELSNLLGGFRADGEAIPGAAKDKQNSFVDFTWSADKSVSLAWVFAPTGSEASMILNAFNAAIDTVMPYLAEDLGWARMGHAGQDGEEAGVVTWFKMIHTTSRPVLELARGNQTEPLRLGAVGDPQLHAHCPMLNVVLTELGRPGSIDLDKLQGKIHEYGAIFQAVLATRLRSMGFSAALDQERWCARIESIPDIAIKEFSKRREQAVEIARKLAADEGKDWDSLSADEKAELTTKVSHDWRQSKNPDVREQEAWVKQAEAIGWKHESAIGAVKPEPLTKEQRYEIAYEASLPFLEKKFYEEAVLSFSDIRVAAAVGLIASGIEGREDLDGVIKLMVERGIRQDGHQTKLIIGMDGQSLKATTELHLGREEQVIAMARLAGQDMSAALTKQQIGHSISRIGVSLSGEQRRAIEKLGTGGRLGVMVGGSGVGKSTSLSVLVDAWQQAGRTVYGAAVAWRQSDDLSQAGILSEVGLNKERLLALSVLQHRAATGRLKLDSNSVIVVDELSLVGTVGMGRLLRLQRQTGAQIVAVGDPEQTEGVEAGAPINMMKHALGERNVPEILTTVRQLSASERETVMMFRTGQMKEAVDRKLRDNTLEIVPGGAQDAVARVAALWAERMAANAGRSKYTLTISAPTNADARAVSAAIRLKRREMKEVGPDIATIRAIDQRGETYDLPVAIGDRLRLFKSVRPERSRIAIGRNGSIVTLTGMNQHGLTLRNAKGREGLVTWEKLQHKGTGRTLLSYGDALTISSAQGITSTEHIGAFIRGSQSVIRRAVYVAMSRHRERAYLVTSDGAERLEVSARRPLGDQRPIAREDVIENIVRNLSRIRDKTSAALFVESARMTAGQSDLGLHRATMRKEQGASPTIRARMVLRQAQQLIGEIRLKTNQFIRSQTMSDTSNSKPQARMTYVERLRQRYAEIQADERRSEQPQQQTAGVQQKDSNQQRPRGQGQGM